MCTCRLMSSRAPNAPPTPPSSGAPCPPARPRQAAICSRSSCSHCVATYSSTPAPPGSGIGQRGLQPEERLILHADLVGALDDDVADDRLVAADDPLVAETLPSGWIGGCSPSIACSGSVSGASTSYSTTIASQRPPAGLGMVGGDGGDGSPTYRTNSLANTGWSLADQPVGRLAGHVVGGDDRVHPVDLPRRRHVDAHDPRVRVRRAQRRAPQQALGRQVAGEREPALHLGARRRDGPALSPSRPPSRPRRDAVDVVVLIASAAATTATRCTASMIRP